MGLGRGCVVGLDATQAPAAGCEEARTMTATVLLPGDLDRMRFALNEAGDISTAGLIRRAGMGKQRGLAALHEMLARGDAGRSVGHHHGDGDFCECLSGTRAGLPRMTHWYLRGES